MNKLRSLLILVILVLSSCNESKQDITSTLESINAEDLKQHISVLASDEFGGRAPASEGEQKTINYISGQFSRLGLEPGNNGSWFQEVAMIRLTAEKIMQLGISGGKGKLGFNSPDDFIGGTPQTNDLIKFDNSEMIFVGYGIVAPEYNWNDYDGLDVKGKTVVMLVNDPGYATGDTALFTGKAMTYYGRWTYKFEEAARQGATAALIIHETGAAGYPWAVVQNSWSGPQFYLENNEFLGSTLLFKGWLTSDAAKQLFTVAGVEFEKTVQAAATRGFRAIPLNTSASLQFRNSVEHVKSNNVAALWKGSDRSDECIIYTAHWDHLGINPDFEGDSILNGAVDNATGIAGLLGIAKAFTSLPERQERSILFLAVTAEEQGLLGSEYYARNPIFPLDKTVAEINMDALNIFGSTKDMTIVGFGNSQLDDYTIKVLEKYNRYASPDPTPEKGGYFRSDHFPFARKGVPALYLSKGVDNIEHGKEWALAESEKWISENYHKPSDNYEPDKWDFKGMTDDIKVIFEVGYDLSMTDDFPEWKSGFPFKPLRDEMMAGAIK
ncbi:MAG TPA: M28 family metallopeptidase [Bacteroidales bacterium]|nr:M28 family metallopeptidase [Bacteroidales bacterium]